MKKILSIALSIILILSLASCAAVESTEKSDELPPAEATLFEFMKELNAANLEGAGKYTTTPESFSTDSFESGFLEDELGELSGFADSTLKVTYAALKRFKLTQTTQISNNVLCATFDVPDLFTFSQTIAEEILDDESALAALENITDEDEAMTVILGLVFDRMLTAFSGDDIPMSIVDFDVTFEEVDGELKISNADELIASLISFDSGFDY